MQKNLNNLYLKSFIRCKRKAWLDYQGNKSQRIWSPHQSIEIIKRYKTFYKLSDGDLYSGEKACKRGSNGVIGLKARSKVINNINAEKVGFFFNDSQSSAVITNLEDKEFKYIVMPMRL